jgi:hypothetical protein
MQNNLSLISPLINALYAPGCELSSEELRDALSKGQLDSKLHLVKILAYFKLKEFNTVHHLACWHGLLSNWLIQNKLLSYKKYKLVDTNLSALAIAKQVVSFENVTCVYKDIQVYQDYSKNDFIINTSCEHTSYLWKTAAPKGTMCALQSSNMPHLDHVNSESSLDSFLYNLKLSEVYSSTELTLYGCVKRFTVVGKI